MPLRPAIFPEQQPWIAQERRGTLKKVLALIQNENHTPATFLELLLRQPGSYKPRAEFVEKLPGLLKIVKSEDVLKPWAIERVTSFCEKELATLRTVPALRGHANKLALETVREFNVGVTSLQMKKNAPTLFGIVSDMLGIQAIRVHSEIYTDPNGVVNEPKKQKVDRKHVERIQLRTATILGILLVNSNQQVNLLQTCMGCYLHASHTSERVLSTLHHSGISVSRSSTLYSVPSLSKGVAQELLDVMKVTGGAVAFDNFNLNFTKAEDTLIARRRQENITTATAHAYTHPKEWLNYRKEVADHRKSHWIKPNVKLLLQSPIDGKGVSRDLRVRKAMIWHIVDALLENVPQLNYLKSQHGETPGEVDQLPLRKDKQYPLKAIDRDESTLEGIIGVMDEIDQQCGWVDDVGEENQIRLFDGDLATVERANGARDHRQTQEGVTNLRKSLEHFIIRPGFFHLKMCAAFSLFRTYLEKPEARKHDLLLFGLVRILKPDDSNKIGSKPTFRMLHEVYKQALLASFGDCWRLEVPGGNLAAFAATRPSLSDLEEVAVIIMDKYVAHMMKEAGGYEGEDAVFHNQRLLHRDLLLYGELSHAMNSGDIGRIEDILPCWIYMWRGTGQVKYAKEIHVFLTDLQYNYPPPVARAIRVGWLVNPTGKKHCWRGVDWVEEYNNLLIENMCGKDSSSRTLKRILDNSNVIMVFRNIFKVYDENYGNISRTIHHSTPDMSPKINLVQEFMQQRRMNEETDNRGEEYGHRVLNQIAKGATKLLHMPAGGSGEEIPEEDEVVGNPLQADDDMDRAFNLSV